MPRRRNWAKTASGIIRKGAPMVLTLTNGLEYRYRAGAVIDASDAGGVMALRMAEGWTRYVALDTIASITEDTTL